MTKLREKDVMAADVMVRIPTIVDTDSDECGHLWVEG
jgi:hypothetical protein